MIGDDTITVKQASPRLKKTRRGFRFWMLLHKWTSLISTIFLLVICLTGLPLLFSNEIDQWQDPRSHADLPADAPLTNVDLLVAKARALFPQEIVTSLFITDAAPEIYLWVAPSWAAVDADPQAEHFIRFDSHSGEMIGRLPSAGRERGFMDVMLSLHTDLFAGLPGELFLGVMGLLFVTAIVSGIVLYAPFARKLDFGTIRTTGGRATRGPRLKWLDLHNLLGVVTLAWALVVGATGVINELSVPLFALWQRTDLHQVLAPFQGESGQAEPGQGEPAAFRSPQAAIETAAAALPGMSISGIVFPGSADGSPYHYMVWLRGNTPFTAQLFTPALVDARSGRLTAVVSLPWYLQLLQLSQPLHFGDYGGLPLKIIWALLDIVTIVVLGSGIYLWLPVGRRRASRGGDVAG